LETKEQYKKLELKDQKILPFAFTGEEFKTSGTDSCILWIIFCFVGILVWIYSYVAVLIFGAILLIYRWLSSVILKVLPGERGPVVEVKRYGKILRLETPIVLNTIWKYDKDPGGLTNQLDIVVFLQARDANNVLTTFYERSVMSDRYPHEARYVTENIEEPQHSYKVERVDKLLEYFSRVLSPELIVFHDEKN